MKYFSVTILLFLKLFLFSQSTDNKGLKISLNLAHGSIIPEYQFVNAIVEKNITQIEFSIFRETNGDNFWQKIYKYPKFGVSAFFSSLGNKEIFGDEFAIYPFVTFQSNPTSKFHVENKIGLGLGLATKKYEIQTNFENVAVGSHLNIHFSYHLGLNYEISNKLNVFSGLDFHHFSNANMREPNLGLNMLSLSFGTGLLIGSTKNKMIPETPTFNKRNDYQIVSSFGGKHTRALQSKVFYTISNSLEYKRRLSHIFSLGLGIDYFFDSSSKTEMKPENQIYFKKIDNHKTGIHISQEFSYNKFSFILQEGIYIGLKDKVNNNIMYNKAILRYKFAKKIAIQLGVKSHLHILDFPELGFLYKL